MAGLKNGNPRHTLTVEEARKGGRKSGETRRERKAFAEAYETLLRRNYTNSQGQEMQGVDILAAKTFQAALDGDLRALIEIRSIVGEQPVQRIEVDTIDPQARAEMDELLGLGGEQ